MEFIGDTPTTRIIDFLIENKGMDYSKTDIADGSGISRATLFKYWDKMEEFGLVKETRRFGKTKLYTLNTGSELTQELLRMESTLIRQTMDEAYKEQLKEIVPIPA